MVLIVKWKEAEQVEMIGQKKEEQVLQSQTRQLQDAAGATSDLPVHEKTGRLIVT